MSFQEFPLPIRHLNQEEKHVLSYGFHTMGRRRERKGTEKKQVRKG